MLAPDAVLVGDGGGKARSIGTPMVGAAQVGRALGDLLPDGSRTGASTLRPAVVNGGPGLPLLRRRGPAGQRRRPRHRGRRDHARPLDAEPRQARPPRPGVGSRDEAAQPGPALATRTRRMSVVAHGQILGLSWRTRSRKTEMPQMSRAIRWSVVAATSALVALTIAAPSQAADRPTARAAIVGGQPAGSSAYIAALLKSDTEVALGTTDYDKQFCGGSLIDARTVLTAAHCVFDNGVLLAPYQMEVLIGRPNLLVAGGRKHAVAAITPHPAYNPATNQYDLARITLADYETTLPVAVIAPGQEGLWPPNTTGYIAGWGALAEGGPYPSQLQIGAVPIRDDQTCVNRPGSAVRSGVAAVRRLPRRRHRHLPGRQRRPPVHLRSGDGPPDATRGDLVRPRMRASPVARDLRAPGGAGHPHLGRDRSAPRLRTHRRRPRLRRRRRPRRRASSSRASAAAEAAASPSAGGPSRSSRTFASTSSGGSATAGSPTATRSPGRMARSARRCRSGAVVSACGWSCAATPSFTRAESSVLRVRVR